MIRYLKTDNFVLNYLNCLSQNQLVECPCFFCELPSTYDVFLTIAGDCLAIELCRLCMEGIEQIEAVERGEMPEPLT